MTISHSFSILNIYKKKKLVYPIITKRQIQIEKNVLNILVLKMIFFFIKEEIFKQV